MPVSVLSPTTTQAQSSLLLKGHKTTMPSQTLTIAEIKDQAREVAYKASRNTSVITLIRSAKQQCLRAIDSKLAHDPREALSSYMKAVSLIRLVMESDEFKRDARAKGVLYREWAEFSQTVGKNMKAEVSALEQELMESDGIPASPTDDTSKRPGGSIADRVNALQNAAGTNLQTTKRISKDTGAFSPSSPTSTSDTLRSPRYQSASLSAQPSASNYSSAPRSSASSVASTPSLPVIPLSSSSSSSSVSAHAFVPVSSLGRGSRPSSPVSPGPPPPQPSDVNFSISDFNEQYPSIEALDDLVSGMSAVTMSSASSSAQATQENGKPGRREATVPRTFQISQDSPGPRPSSTPIPPVPSSLASRPASPSKQYTSASGGIKTSPGPSGNNDNDNNGPASIVVDNVAISGYVTPKQLRALMDRQGFKVLLLDIRTREEFNAEHIMGAPVVCIEPTILMRADTGSKAVEDALSVGPTEAAVLFTNREKFDLVVIYNSESETLGSQMSPISALVRAIYENEFRVILRHMPALLIGGLSAWKRDIGETGLVKRTVEPLSIKKRLSSGTTGSTVSESPPVHGAANGQKAPPAPLSDEALTWNGDGGEHTGPIKHPMTPRAIPYTPVPVKPLSVASPRPTVANGGVPHSILQYSGSPNQSSTYGIQYPSFPQGSSSASPSVHPTSSSSSLPLSSASTTTLTSTSAVAPNFSHSGHYDHVVSPPPQASINPVLSRRRSDYVDQAQDTYNSLPHSSRQSIDYPNLSSSQVTRPPPAAVQTSLERQLSGNRVIQNGYAPPASYRTGAPPQAPTLPITYAVSYWPDLNILTSGLKNMGNTCYMSATIQCLNATYPFARFFIDARWKGCINMVNPLGTKGALTVAFAHLLREMGKADVQFLAPSQFRNVICQHASQFKGTDQHDSQEFLSFLLDGLHEDLNRVIHKPSYHTTPEQEEELERLSVQVASEREWQIYRMRNDSIVVDFFQGQFRNRMQCLTCKNTSTTYNTFMYLTLPVPNSRSKVSLSQCLDVFVKEEVMEKTDAWHCPKCKALRRATKKLTLSRLPPILLIHLKRFSYKGPTTDKIETIVDFPLRGLDLTNYMPPLLPPDIDTGAPRMSMEDPRLQKPPYRFDLHGVTNHFGTLSSGHYTAHIASRGGWQYCDDSSVRSCEAKDVVNKHAYVLYYKRTKL